MSEASVPPLLGLAVMAVLGAQPLSAVLPTSLLAMVVVLVLVVMRPVEVAVAVVELADPLGLLLLLRLVVGVTAPRFR